MSNEAYTITAPKWRLLPPKYWGRPQPSLPPRPLLKWRIVREFRPVVHADGLVVSGAEHVSWHWTSRSADRALDKLIHPEETR